MRCIVAGILLATLVAGCGGSTSVVPAAVADTDELIVSGFADVLVAFASFRKLELLLTDPEGAEAAGIVFDPDPEGPANQFLFEFPYDSDGDGSDDATANGVVLLPLAFGNTGTAEFEIDDPDRTASAELQFRMGAAGVEVWGSGATTDDAAGVTVEFTIPPSMPISVARAPTDGGNLCEYDLQGPIEVEAETPSGIYALVLRFLFGSLNVSATDRVFTALGEPEPQPQPDSSMQLPGCREVDLEDWVGSWVLHWECIPPSDGTSIVTFTVSGPNTLLGEDDGEFDFTATADPGNPRVLRGFFIDTDSGGTYREDFVFTLAPDGQSWSQNNTYEYQSGPLAGSTGVCGGTAFFLPP